MIGLVLGGFGVGGVLGSFAGSWFQRRLRPNMISLLAVWIWALFTPLVALLKSPFLIAAVLAVLAFVGPAWNVAMNTVYLRLVPDNMVGKVSSFGSLASLGALPLGSAAAGLLLQNFGPIVSALVLAGWTVLISLVTTLSPTIRRGPVEPPKAAAPAAPEA